MNVVSIHIKMIRRNTWRDYFATLRFCFTFFDWRTALRLPVYVTPLVQYKKPIDKHRIVLDKTGRDTQPASLLVGYMDREYAGDKSSLINIRGTLSLRGEGTRYFAPGVSLCIMDNASVTIGTKFSASHNLRLFALKSITIGDDNMWSYDCVVLDSDGHQILDERGEQINKAVDVHFGNHVWLGARNVVLKGSEIPDGSIVGACQQIRKSYMNFKAPMIICGEVKKENIIWNRNLVQ